MSTHGSERNDTVWDVWPEDAPPPTPWSFDPRDGAVQGPLELGSFAGSGLRLQLARGQTGLLAHNHGVRATWFEGSHLLRVGHGPGQLPPEGRLFMFADNVALACRWGETSPPAAAGRTDAPRGNCAFHIVAPTLFYDVFLRHAETTGEAFIRRLLGTLVQARIEERVAAAGDPARPSPRLAAELTPADLADGWSELGVSLSALTCDPTGAARGREASRPAGQPAPARV
ncbi:MAG: hypothetical protein ACYDIE_01575 [Candidatus Krumholzibacteriia bacterium]